MMASLEARSKVGREFSVKGIFGASLVSRQSIILDLVTVPLYAIAIGTLVGVHNLCTLMNDIRFFADFVDLEPEQIKLHPQGWELLEWLDLCVELVFVGFRGDSRRLLLYTDYVQ